MSYHLFIRFLKDHIIWFIVLPIVTAATVYYFTRKERKEYTVQATIYTGLGSGYNLKSVNSSGSFDYSGVTNAFDNLLTTLNSSETMLQVGISLLTDHLKLTKPDTLILGAKGFEKLHQAIPAPLANHLARQADAVRYAQIDSMGRSEAYNPIKALLAKGDMYYSGEYISKKLRANRKNSSDMLEMEYESDDPAVTIQTLDFVIAILNQRYISLKSSDTNPVIGYYEQKTNEAKRRLDAAESKLRAFNVDHELLSYDEESKNIAFSRENFVNEYNLELMKNRATKASIDELSKRMSQRGNLLVINSELVKKQAELADAQGELVGAQTSRSNSEIVRIEAKIRKITDEMKVIAQKYYAAGDSPESIPSNKLIEDWLAKVLEYAESNARLEVYKQRLNEYQNKITELSPLGTELRQLNRELEVAEKEYLALTQSLNEAQVHRQDISLDKPLKVVDPPKYPYTAKPTKRLIFIAAGFGIGLFFALMLTVIRFLLDSRLDSPEHAEVRIGQSVTIVFPKVKKFSIGTKESRAAISMFEQLSNAINIDIVQATSKQPPPIITLFSMRSKQGKTWVAHGVARLYAETGQKIAYFYPRITKNDQPFELEGVTFYPFEIRPEFMNVRDLNELLPKNQEYNPFYFDKILLELPALISSPLPVYLLHKSHVAILVADANSGWGRRERQLMALYNKIASSSLITVLNRVESDYIDAPSRSEAEQILVQPELLLKHQRKLPSASEG